MGAEALLGQGDMLYLPPGSGYPQRIHGAFVADHEVHKVVEYLKEHGEPNYIEEILKIDDEESDAGNSLDFKKPAEGEADPLYDEAVALAKKFGAAESHRFVNGVLDKVARDLRPAEAGRAR